MLSIVVIGRNEGSNLARLAASIKALKSVVPFPVETIFVDSASSDNSPAFARQHFDSVHELQDSPHLCASAGRFLGTLEARYPWIFYLDGDMEICPEFFPVIASLDQLEPEYAGVIGFYVHRFANGNVAIQTFARGTGTTDNASQFGGAVILRREAVLQAGNWDPSIYGKEEMELYVRLGNGKPVVKFARVPMAYHFSEYYSRLELLRRLLYPSAGLGKVFWGYGQSIRALYIKGHLLALLRLDYEAYVFWATLLLVGAIGLVWSINWALLAVFLVFVGFSVWLRPGSLVRYLTLPLSLVPGWFRYFPWFRPLLSRWAAPDETAR